MFLLAFLPEFIEPSRGPAWLQIAALGSVLALAGTGFHDECYTPDLAS